MIEARRLSGYQGKVGIKLREIIKTKSTAKQPDKSCLAGEVAAKIAVRQPLAVSAASNK